MDGPIPAAAASAESRNSATTLGPGEQACLVADCPGNPLDPAGPLLGLALVLDASRIIGWPGSWAELDVVFGAVK